MNAVALEQLFSPDVLAALDARYGVAASRAIEGPLYIRHDATGIEWKTLRRAIARGEIVGARLGKFTYFEAAELARYVAAHRIAAGQRAAPANDEATEDGVAALARELDFVPVTRPRTPSRRRK